jgi:hypothetical protein
MVKGPAVTRYSLLVAAQLPIAQAQDAVSRTSGFGTVRDQDWYSIVAHFALDFKVVRSAAFSGREQATQRLFSNTAGFL